MFFGLKLIKYMKLNPKYMIHETMEVQNPSIDVIYKK